jgi:hypothetical protein
VIAADFSRAALTGPTSHTHPDASNNPDPVADDLGLLLADICRLPLRNESVDLVMDKATIGESRVHS